MINIQGTYEIELDDEIRMNQFIRGGINFERFLYWYNEINIQEQSVLVSALFECAYQAGIDDNFINNAFEKSGISCSEQDVKKILELETDFDSIEDFYLLLAIDKRSVVFKFAVYLFGIIESHVFLNICSNSDNCNHWWHRDLLDKNVIESIRNNPKYYLTSKKDDT